MKKQILTNYTNTLRAHRKQHKLLQSELADLLGFQGTDRISHWEKGSNIPSLPNLIKLCLLFNLNVFDLYPNLTKMVEGELDKNKQEILIGRHI